MAYKKSTRKTKAKITISKSTAKSKPKSSRVKITKYTDVVSLKTASPDKATKPAKRHTNLKPFFDRTIPKPRTTRFTGPRKSDRSPAQLRAFYAKNK